MIVLRYISSVLSKYTCYGYLLKLSSLDSFNPIAFRKTKIVYNFGLSECSGVKEYPKCMFYGP